MPTPESPWAGGRTGDGGKEHESQANFRIESMARAARAGRTDGKAMQAQETDHLKEALTACRRVWVGVALFSACLNMLMLSVPLYMMQIYDRVLATANVDTLLALTVMVMVALLVLGLLDALRGRVMARVGGWLDRELGSPVLAGAVADALRSGGGVSAQGLRDLATVRGFLGGTGVMPLFDAPWAPVFLAIIFLIHPVLGWIGLGGAIVLFGVRGTERPDDPKESGGGQRRRGAAR